jgi:hypothetical protein
MKMNEPQGFKTGLRQYQEDLKKQKGLKNPNDDRGGYGGGYGGRGGRNNNAEDWYGSRYD